MKKRCLNKIWNKQKNTKESIFARTYWCNKSRYSQRLNTLAKKKKQFPDFFSTANTAVIPNLGVSWNTQKSFLTKKSLILPGITGIVSRLNCGEFRGQGGAHWNPSREYLPRQGHILCVLYWSPNSANCKVYHDSRFFFCFYTACFFASHIYWQKIFPANIFCTKEGLLEKLWSENKDRPSPKVPCTTSTNFSLTPPVSSSQSKPASLCPLHSNLSESRAIRAAPQRSGSQLWPSRPGHTVTVGNCRTTIKRIWICWIPLGFMLLKRTYKVRLSSWQKKIPILI